MSYHHLSQFERYQIYLLRKNKYSIRSIAGELERSVSTISREIARNSGERGYRNDQAHQLALKAACNSRNALQIDANQWKQAQFYLRMDYSPEQAGAMVGVSHPTIYQRVREDKKAGGDLYKHLRGAKKRRKRYGTGHDKRGQIANKRSIDERPQRVETRSQIGDWEIDTVMGANHKQCIVTIVERKTGHAFIERLYSKHAIPLAQAVIRMLEPVKHRVKTITSDNGKEFAGHQEMAKALGCDWFFAHPYSSWERGCNENFNGLLRQYIPKKTKLESLTDEQIKQFQNKLNNRIRKRLGYVSPASLFERSVNSVALRI